MTMVTSSVAALADDEIKLLHECEAKIERGISAAVDMGRALATIRDRQLYRGEYITFADYCKERWNKSARHAYMLIEGFKVVEQLQMELAAVSNVNHGSQDNSDNNYYNLPTKERQTRELAKLPTEARAEVWQEAQKDAGTKQPSGRQIRDTAAKLGATRQTVDDDRTSVVDAFFADPEPIVKQITKAEAVLAARVAASQFAAEPTLENFSALDKATAQVHSSNGEWPAVTAIANVQDVAEADPWIPEDNDPVGDYDECADAPFPEDDAPFDDAVPVDVPSAEDPAFELFTDEHPDQYFVFTAGEPLRCACCRVKIATGYYCAECKALDDTQRGAKLAEYAKNRKAAEPFRSVRIINAAVVKAGGQPLNQRLILAQMEAMR